MTTFKSVEKMFESLCGEQLKEFFEQETKLRITL